MTNTTNTTTSNNFIASTVHKDANRLVEENKSKGWKYNFALAVLACRYTNQRYKDAARQILEERLRDTEYDTILDEGAN